MQAKGWWSTTQLRLRGRAYKSQAHLELTSQDRDPICSTSVSKARVQGTARLADEAQELRALGTRLSLLQHHRDPRAWVQLFDYLEGPGLISSEDR